MQGLRIGLTEFEEKSVKMEELLNKLNLNQANDIDEKLATKLGLSTADKKIDPTLLSLIVLSQNMRTLQVLSGMRGNISAIQQSIYDNPEQALNLREQDFQNYEFVVSNFFDKSGLPNIASFTELITFIKEYSSAVPIEEESFNSRLVAVTERVSQFSTSLKMLNNPSYSQNMGMKKLIDDSRIEVYWSTSLSECRVKIEARVEEKYEEFLLEQLSRYKDEAYFIKKKVEEIGDERERKETIARVDKFLEIYTDISALS
jgi:hypothetical protein